MSKELETKVASLTTELAEANTALTQAQKNSQEAIKAAAQKATQETIKAQQTRIDSIDALCSKYGKDGDLDGIARKAIREGKSADDFKDEVLEVLSKRPTSHRIENGTGGNASGLTEIDQLRAQNAEETDPVEKGRLTKKIIELRDK